MSKKFYVLFSLKELFQPRLFKTKQTVTKYIKENDQLQFRQFVLEKDAQQFMLQVQQDMQNLIVTSDNPQLQAEISPFQDNPRDTFAQKGTSPTHPPLSSQIIDQGTTVNQGMDINKMKIKQPMKQDFEVVEDELFQLSQERQENSYSVLESEKLSKEDMLKDILSSIDKIAIQFDAKASQKSSKSIQVQEEEQFRSINTDQAIVEEEQTFIQQSLEMDSKEYLENDSEKQLKQKQSIEIKENLEKQLKEDFGEQKFEEKESVGMLEKDDSLEIFSDKVDENLCSEKEVQAQMNSNTLSPDRVDNEPSFSEISKENKISTERETLPPPTEHPSSSQNLTQIPENIELELPFQYLNIPKVNARLKLNGLTRRVDEKERSGCVKIQCFQKQNPGMAIVQCSLKNGVETINHVKMLGVQSRTHAQGMALRVGLQLASAHRLKDLQVQSDFPCKSKKYLSSIDPRLRTIMKPIPTIEQSFSTINYI